MLFESIGIYDSDDMQLLFKFTFRIGEGID
jgi:hypothetical protein